MIWPVVVGGFLGILIWHYAGYPLVLWAVVAIRSSSAEPGPADEWPSVSVIIIAHNEEDVIEDRIKNVLSADYPREKVEIVVASDASTDGTMERATNVVPDIVSVENPKQNKSVTRNMGVQRASHDVLLFTDADTRYRTDCIKNLVAHFMDPEVGGVCGSLVSRSFEEGAIGKGMGVYWKWEYFLRRTQGRLGLLVKYSGANMGMRRSFFREIPDDVDIDQMAGLDVLVQGGKSIFEPSAVAVERFPTSLEGELSTRRRLTIRALTALAHHRKVLNPLSDSGLAVHVWSYWLLRYWIPLLLVGTTFATLFSAQDSRLFTVFLGIQIAGYSLGTVGYGFERRGLELAPVSILFSYLWANVGVLLGLLAFLSGKRVYAYSDQH